MSAYKANIDRIGTFIEKLDEVEETPEPDQGGIQMLESERLKFENLTILTPDSARVLIESMTLEFLPGASYLIMGPSGAGKSSLFRVIAELWNTGDGVIYRPPMEDIMFLPQQPYVPIGTLREALCYPREKFCATTATLLSMLKMVNLSDIPVRVGGIDVETNWREVLSVGEQQRLSFARLILAAPKYALLDEATSALDAENQEILYTLIQSIGSTVISIGHRSALRQYHDYILEIEGDGTWRFSTSDKSRPGGDTGLIEH